MALDDFLELDLYLEDSDYDEVALWVTCRNRDMLKFDNVRHNPVRWHGVWSIAHEFFGQRATSILPADEVWYFTTVHKVDNRPEGSGDDAGSPASFDPYLLESVLMNGDPEVDDE